MVALAYIRSSESGVLVLTWRILLFGCFFNQEVRMHCGEGEAKMGSY